MEKHIITIFTDAATSSKHMISIGGILCCQQEMLDYYAQLSTSLNNAIAANIKYMQYSSKKSTWAEITTVIDAIKSVIKTYGRENPTELYTDCQSFYDLLNRRKEKLIKNNYVTSSGKIHAHAGLYKELFALTEQLELKVIKIKGHASASQRRTLHEKIFTVIDKLSRKKLQSVLKNSLVKMNVS